MLRKAGSSALQLTLRRSTVAGAQALAAAEQCVFANSAATVLPQAAFHVAITRLTQPEYGTCQKPSFSASLLASLRQHSTAAAALPDERSQSHQGSSDPSSTACQPGSSNNGTHPQGHNENSSAQGDQSGQACWIVSPTYDRDYLESVHPYHIPPVTIRQKIAYFAIQVTRRLFDTLTGYKEHGMTEAKFLRRIIFLETVAGVPGMVAGMLRHMKSLRAMRRDHGWIHTLLQEADNERLHLMSFMEMRKPGPLFRFSVLLAQGAFFNAYFIAYLLSPKTCHYFIGYLEEEAVKTYTHALADLDAGKLPAWSNAPAPTIAKDYWKLGPDATMRDLLLNVRADEASHSHVNHTFGDMHAEADNPFDVGNHTVPVFGKDTDEREKGRPVYGRRQ